MTITNLLKRLHTLLEKDTSYPTVGEEDYTVRLELLCDAIGIWEKDNENGTQWKELFTSVIDSETGDTQTIVGETVYDCPTDFVFPVSFIKISYPNADVYYRKIEPSEANSYVEKHDDVYYITGNKRSGYKIHLMNTIPDDVYDINYDYYKTAFLPTTGTDSIEMDDDQFAVYWALSELTKDDDSALSSTYSQVAINKLDGMRLKNGQISAYQDNSIIDTFGGF